MADPEVTILVPNNRTPELTRLCLRLLRRHTDPARAVVCAIDNDSGDDSVAYLRSLEWIRLIERKGVPGESVAEAHARALDLALAEVATRYVLSIHSDTLVRHSGWLDTLIGEIEGDPRIGGVGSWKLEERPILQRLAKAAERQVQRVVFPLIGRGHGKLEGLGDNWYYLRSHCALYRMAPLRDHGLGFADGGMVAGKMMHRRLVDLGYKMVFLPAAAMRRQIAHVNHATMVLNPQLGADRRTIVKGKRRIERVFAELGAAQILADDSLDR